MAEVKPEFSAPWTAPQDYVFDPADPAAGLQVGADQTVAALMADGSTHTLPADLPKNTWLHLFLMNDGHVVNWRE